MCIRDRMGCGLVEFPGSERIGDRRGRRSCHSGVNEFLGALPKHLLRVSGGQVEEQWIVSDQAGGGSSAAPDLREEWSTLSTPARAELDLLFGTTSAARLAPLSSDGFMEVRPGVGVFLQRIRHVFAESWVITFDYGDWLAGATEDIREGGKVVTHGRSLRTYSHHQSGGNILSYAGKRDITADVDFR